MFTHTSRQVLRADNLQWKWQHDSWFRWRTASKVRRGASALWWQSSLSHAPQRVRDGANSTPAAFFVASVSSENRRHVNLFHHLLCLLFFFVLLFLRNRDCCLIFPLMQFTRQSAWLSCVIHCPHSFTAARLTACYLPAIIYDYCEVTEMSALCGSAHSPDCRRCEPHGRVSLHRRERRLN